MKREREGGGKSGRERETERGGGGRESKPKLTRVIAKLTRYFLTDTASPNQAD